MLKNKLEKYTLILASGSPRRQQFFKDLDLDFEIRLKEIEEIYPPELKAAQITNYLATLKASVFEGELKPNEILITSDTIVAAAQEILNKIFLQSKLARASSRMPLPSLSLRRSYT